MKIIEDPKILDIVKGYKIPLHSKPFLVENTFQTNSESRRGRIGETGGKRNVEEGSHQKSSTIKRGVYKQLNPCKTEGWGSKTSDKLEATECIYPILSLQNGRFAKSGMHVAKRRLHERSGLKKMHIFQFPWKKVQDNLLAFVVQETCTSFFAFASVWDQHHKYSQKLLKVPMKILRSINIKIIIYLGNMLLIGRSLEEIVIGRDTVIVLLQHLRFVINWKKSVLTPVQKIEFLGLEINSVTLELSLNKTKIHKVVSDCQNLLNNPQTSVLELTRLIGLFTLTNQAVLPARLNCRFLQIQQISSLSENISYLYKIVLNENSKIELNGGYRT